MSPPFATSCYGWFVEERPVVRDLAFSLVRVVANGHDSQTKSGQRARLKGGLSARELTHLGLRFSGRLAVGEMWRGARFS
jgi:hypothetical protein